MAEEEKKSIISLGSAAQRVAQERRAHQNDSAQALDFLDFMIGHWQGEGKHGDASLTGVLTVQRRLGGTFLEAHECLRNERGNLDYEDVTIYRYNASDQHLRVLQLVAPAWTSERFAFPLTDGPGVRWFGGPHVPTVVIRLEGAVLVSTVHHPQTHLVESWMRYQRTEPGQDGAASPQTPDMD